LWYQKIPSKIDTLSTVVEGTETRPDYLVTRADKKIEGPLGEKIAQKSRNSRRVSGGGVGAKDIVTKGVSPETKYTRSKNVFTVTSIALSLEIIYT